MPVLPSYRNQSIDVHSKSIDWFLYESNTSTQWVNYIPRNEEHSLRFYFLGSFFILELKTLTGENNFLKVALLDFIRETEKRWGP